MDDTRHMLIELVPTLAPFGVLRALRGVRLLSLIARLFALDGIASSEGRGLIRRHAAAFALGMARFTWITSAVAFTLVEEIGEGHACTASVPSQSTTSSRAK
jgi:hypothetical protein